MPIRINLLAEDQAAEELRRKDPVKRGYLVAGLLVLIVLVWACTLKFKIWASRSELSELETKWKEIEKGYQVAVNTQRSAIETEQKLAALQQLTTNRFLWGTALNALQQSMNGVDDVQVVRVKTDQAFTVSEEVKARTNNTTVVAAKPAAAIEKISLTIDAIDYSPQPGSYVNRFKEAIANVPYFQGSLQKTNGVLLTSLSAPQGGPGGRTPFVTFTLQCFFPERVR